MTHKDYYSNIENRKEVFFMTEERFLSVKEVSKIFSLSTRTIWRWIERGDLDAIKVGKSVRISTNEVERLKKGVK